MKKILLSILYLGLPYFALTIAWKSFDDVINSQVVLSSAFSSLLFAVFFTLFAKYLTKSSLKKIQIELNPEDEKIIKEDGANHFKGAEGVGGKLVLTNKRLIFKSHKFNIQNHEESIGLGQIKTVERRKTWHIINNGLLLQLVNNDVHKFVVNSASEWVNTIDQQRRIQRQ
ncbi:MAG TPA: GRAM domain-containing protein [Cyclobacteriaceae bacterium]|nr:GRAM domain-containing protein [Cyclobacteriaceae bacterium]